MYERLRRLYLAGSLTDTGLESAVARGWLTQEQAETIQAEATTDESA